MTQTPDFFAHVDYDEVAEFHERVAQRCMCEGRIASYHMAKDKAQQCRDEATKRREASNAQLD